MESLELLEKMHDELLKERGRGVTNNEMAKRAGISQPHINFLLNSEAINLGSLKFNTVLRLFPRIAEQIERYYAVAKADDHSVAEVVGTGYAEANNNSRATVSNPQTDTRFDALEGAILDDPKICDACKVATLRHIREAAKQ